MADEDITLDGKPLQSLRVADLKAALEQRNLSKSGHKNALIKRLKGALMLENLQKSSASHSGLQPNSQIGEEMSQNSFIKQYLAKQQELLRQRLEREAQQDDEDDESSAVADDDDDHSDDNDSSSNSSGKHPLTRTEEEEEEGGGPLVSHGMKARGADMGRTPVLKPRESSEAPGNGTQRATFHLGHKEPPAPSPPRAVASLSVRVLGQPDRQGLPPHVPRAQEKEGTAPSEPGSAYPILHLSRSAGISAGGHAYEDSGEDDDGDDESDDDEDWGPSPGKARQARRVPPQPQPLPPSVPSAVARSKRKLQPPQHIPPPPQVHQNPMQLRHPTPPPSPPPELSFPLPDTPKQSPPDTDDPDGEGDDAGRGRNMASFSPPAMQRQDSDFSSRSSSPEPPVKRRPGPLSLLVHKMEAEGAFGAEEAAPVAEGMAHSTTGPVISAGSVDPRESPVQRLDSRTKQEDKEEEKERVQQDPEEERRKIQEEDIKKKQLEEYKEKERKRLEEDEKRRLKEEMEKERRHHEEEKTREEHRLEDERNKRREKAENHGDVSQGKNRDVAGSVQLSHTQDGSDKSTVNQSVTKRSVLKDDSPPHISLTRSAACTEAENASAPVTTTAQHSGSSSDSDSKSESSSSSSQSSSSQDKSHHARQLKKDDHGPKAEEEKKAVVSKGEQKPLLTKREVSEPSAAAVTEVEPDSEGSVAQQSASGAEPDNSEGHLEESTTPKAFATRKISLTSSKMSPATAEGGAGESEATTAAAGRKRRWGSSTAVTAKKPSISITTDSLKSLIPDIKASQEAVVELHPEELQLSGDEENLDTSRDDQDKGLKIRRTVTQVVPGDSQENGQQNEEEEVAKPEAEKQRRSSKDKRKNSHSEEASETQTPVKLDTEAKKVTPSDSVVRRSISQQKSGVSITIDDPVRTSRQLSPPRGKVSTIIHVTNLVRPFTLAQLKELLNRTGSVVEEGFWIDKIKSHCYVTYTTTEEAVATRAALHGVKWPQSNPKVLNVDFCEQDELDFHKGILKPNKEEDHVVLPGPPPNRLPPLMPERDRERDRDRDRERERERERERDRGVVAGVRDQWAERERAMERRERARGEREWDRDKIREFARPGEERPRSRSRDRERRRRERAKSKERKTEKKEKPDEPPAKLLDDLFLKTKAAPCIYWLPLTEEQATQKVLDRMERQKERERKRKEEQEEEQKRLEQEKKERLKVREKEAGATASSGGAGRAADADRERDRGRDREGDRRRDGHRPRRASPATGSGRRSRSRSNPRDRRR